MSDDDGSSLAKAKVKGPQLLRATATSNSNEGHATPLN